MDERRTGTRESIRTVALELFAEQGYDGTSLREIAERLGVTKAAVYYHFKTKEEILGSLVEDFLAQVDDIIGWAEAQPVDAATRHEVLRRYSELLSGRTSELTQFLQDNKTAIRELAAGADMHKRFEQLSGLLITPGQPPAAQLKARLALVALHMGAFAHGGLLGGDEQQRREVALEVALELAGS